MKRILLIAVVLIVVQLGCNSTGSKRKSPSNNPPGDPLYVSPPPPAPTPK